MSFFGIDDNVVGGWSLLAEGVGAGLSAYGSYQRAAQQKAALNYEAQVAGNNAVLAGYQAQIAAQVGQQQEMTSRLHTGQVFGAQRAAMAANGVDLGEGTATDVLTTTKYMGERDALTIRDNTAQRVWAYRNQAQSYENEAAATSATAGAINPLLAGGASLLAGAGSVAKSWYSMNKQGIKPVLF